MVLPLVDSDKPLLATIDEVCGTESSTLCAPLLMVKAPPAADMTTVPDVKVVLLAAIATPPPPPPEGALAVMTEPAIPKVTLPVLAKVIADRLLLVVPAETLMALIKPAVDGEVNVVMYAGIPMLRPLVSCVATMAVPAVVVEVKPVLANTDEDCDCIAVVR